MFNKKLLISEHFPFTERKCRNDIKLRNILFYASLFCQGEFGVDGFYIYSRPNILAGLKKQQMLFYLDFDFFGCAVV
jgi:hypothetical protein